jgi:FkbM family methyltransferase
MSLKSCQTAYGPCKFYGKDQYIGKSLYAYGEWSGEECEKIISLANGLCLDVGANIGFMSMALASTGLAVLAFEPQEELFRLLVENTANMPVVPFHMALGSNMGTAHIPKIMYGSNGNYGGVSLVKAGFATRPVRIDTIDNMNLEDVGFIKIDVEGYELEVLKGAEKTIKHWRPTMYIEDDREDKRAALHAFLEELGYSIEKHRPRLFRPNNFAGNPVDIWDVPYESHNIICRARG